MATLQERLKKLQNNKHFKYGLPFFILMTAGVFGIREFAHLKYEFRKNEMLDPYDLGVKTKKKGEVTLESEYEKIKTIDIDNWENIRGPRLWDETIPSSTNPNQN